MAGAEQGALVAELGPYEKMILDSELLRALSSGSEAHLEELLTRGNSRVAISVQDSRLTGVAAPLQGAGARGLLGVTNGGSTALHLVASRGHLGLANRVCELAPSLVATRNRSLETPLHCAAKAGHRDVAACLLSRMRRSGADSEAALQARNRPLGATALYEAVRNGHAETVALLAAEVPELAAMTTDDGVSPLYLAAMTSSSLEMVRALLRQLPDGTPSMASFAGRRGGLLCMPRQLEAKTMSVKIGSTNRDGLTAADLACNHLEPGFHYFLDPRAVVKNCFYWIRAPVTLGVGVHVHITRDTEEDPKNDVGGMMASGTIASVLIATVTFGAAFTVPGGYIADDHPNAGTAVSARRFAFRAFVMSDTMAFLFSIVATCFLVYGGAGQVPRSHRRFYQWWASGLLPAGAQLMVAAFRGPCRSRRRQQVAHKRPKTFREFFWLFITSFLFKNLMRPLFAMLISVTFVVSVALNIALPDY
ncbi:hypothetical protein PR202_ga10051 [Eleusine coracana subsp. coracana]|uniref:PGG domain-containing protein n=1 Tax=Eleusine coracana subsp. coracana TaxID=191504 RepID=A0AAV5C5P3_ELECO|nr:hypothetical protein PR202_ga10051 [Eleusine coracana subsp. coracana]